MYLIYRLLPMLAHGVNKIFTYNERDFRQFMVLEVMEPN
jgi:hypothetical protein